MCPLFFVEVGKSEIQMCPQFSDPKWAEIECVPSYTGGAVIYNSFVENNDTDPLDCIITHFIPKTGIPLLIIL